MISLRGLLFGSGGPTEARMSIRASLRIFGQIEDYLEVAAKNHRISGESSGCSRRAKLLSQQQPSHLSFERLVAQNANTPNRLSMKATTSCGHTSKCFASLFFSKEQIESNSSILAHTNGTDIVQLWENWNIVWYGIQKRWASSSRRPQLFGGFCSSLVTKILRFRAVYKADALSESLLRIDPPEDLPRVVFCNLTWVLCEEIKTDSPRESMLELRKQTISPDDDDDDDDDGSIDSLKQVKDHQWCIIKHDNDRFQVVQGYIGSVHGNHSNQRGWLAKDVRPDTAVVRAASTSTSDKDVVEGGYCLSDWQHQLFEGDHHLAHGGRFSSRHGFSCMEMEGFLYKILAFAASPSFDAASYKCLFGVFHPESDKVQVWSSVSFRELQDTSIDGYGDRFVANEIARKLPNFFKSHQQPASCQSNELPNCVIYERKLQHNNCLTK